MSASASVREVNGVTIIDLTGRFTNVDAKDLLLVTAQQAGKKSRAIILNLANVTYMDSSVIGEMTGAYTSITNAGGNMKLLNVQKRFRHILQITRLDTVFEVFDDEASAIESFQPSV